MNSRTSFALLAILTAISSLTISSAYAEQHVSETCFACTEEEARAMANERLINSIPISVWTDKTEYGHSDIITVKGKIANPVGSQVTVVVSSPINSIVHIDQVDTADDGSFETMLNTASPLWKYDGIYAIKVNYGSAEKSNTVRVELSGGIKPSIEYDTQRSVEQCGANEVSANVDNRLADIYCIPYSISGGTVTNAMIDTNAKSIVFNINSEDDGVLTVTPADTVQRGMFAVLVDGQQWDDVEIVENRVVTMFPAGTEQIEVIGTWVIPEFGAVVAMILAVAVIAIIAVSAKSRLSIIPRY